MYFKYRQIPKHAGRIGAFLAIVTFATASQADTFFVDKNKTTNPGTSGSGLGDWSEAFITIEEALVLAEFTQGNDEIFVADGTYTPNDLLGTGNQLLTFTIPNGVVIKGGYEGEGGLSLFNRDPKAFLTILSGDFLIGDPDGEDSDFGSRCPSVNQENWHDATRLDNAINVVTVANVSDGTRIDGFTIEGGARGPGGGGMYILDSAIDVVNCTLRFNAAGRPYNPGNLQDLGDNGIGGGALVVGSYLNLVTLENEFTRFINCTFHDNIASQGGGLALVDLSTQLTKVIVLNSLFHDNRAQVLTRDLNPNIDGSGGAIIVYGTNFVPPRQTAENQATIEITNCTVVNNWATISMGGFYLYNVNDMYESLIQNSVFWHNNSGNTCESTPGAEIGLLQGGATFTKTSLKVRYSDVEGNLQSSIGDDGPLTVENGMSLEPLFVDETNKDFRLTATSPVLDGGHPQTSSIPLIPPDDFDLNGNDNIVELTPDLDFMPRELDSQNNGTPRVNMGAYENFFTCCADAAGFDHAVNVTDLLAILGAWGDCPAPCVVDTCTINSPDSCPADIFRDCKVNVTDLLRILARWGSSCAITCDICSSIPMVESTQFPWPNLEFAGQFGPVSDTWIARVTGTARLAADEFEPVVSTTVNQVNWWGFYEGDAGTNCTDFYPGDSFTITYYDSVIHVNTGQLVPDNAIASFTNVNVFIKMVDDDLFVGNSGNNIPVYFYSADHADINVAGGTTYFVEIRNTNGSNGSSGCHWRWLWSKEDDDTLRYSVKKPESFSSYVGTPDPDDLMNLAFGLNIEFRQMTLIEPPPPEPEPDPPPPDEEEDPPGGGEFGKGG